MSYQSDTEQFNGHESETATLEEFVAQIKQTLQDQWQTEQFDFLVNNAGIGIHKPFAETTEDDFARLMNIQFKGVFFLTQMTHAIIPYLVPMY